MSTSASDVLGADSATILARLAREEKRQLRSASNTLANVAGVDADAIHAAVIGGTLEGYTPFVDPTPG